MDTRTGQIHELADGAPVPEGFVKLTADEVVALRERKEEERIYELKRMRREAARAEREDSRRLGKGGRPARLKGRKVKEAAFASKLARRQAIRFAKKAKGQRLNAAEMKESLKAA